jgi:hypothetical protein
MILEKHGASEVLKGLSKEENQGALLAPRPPSFYSPFFVSTFHADRFFYRRQTTQKEQRSKKAYE